MSCYKKTEFTFETCRHFPHILPGRESRGGVVWVPSRLTLLVTGASDPSELTLLDFFNESSQCTDSLSALCFCNVAEAPMGESSFAAAASGALAAAGSSGALAVLAAAAGHSGTLAAAGSSGGLAAAGSSGGLAAAGSSGALAVLAAAAGSSGGLAAAGSSGGLAAAASAIFLHSLRLARDE